MKNLKAALCLSFIIAQALLTSCAWSKTVSRDLLSNWGDFESPANIITFNSYYVGLDYDYDADGRWSQPYSGSREGYALPTPNDTLGNGWGRVTKVHVNPEKNMICKLMPGGIDNSSCQYAALKDLNNWGEVSVYSRVVVASRSDYTGSNLRPGDKIIFKIDHLKMADFDGVRATYALTIIQNGTSEKATKKTVVVPSETPFSAQIEATIVPDVDKVFVSFSVGVDGGTNGKTPGMYVDGAHLYVMRAGKTVLENAEVPAKRDRTIKTSSILWQPENETGYSVATSSDYIVPFCHRVGNYSSILRALNPNVRIYSYFATGIIQADAGPKDSWYGTSLGYQFASQKHPEWLYTDGVTPEKYLTVPGYSRNYFSKRTDPAYQQAWCQDILSKLNKREFDGIFVDEAGPYPRMPAGNALPIIQPEISLGDTQQFLHAITPVLQAAGYDLIYNATDNPLTTGAPGRVTLCPTWNPDTIYPESQGFSSNSKSNVPRCRLREWAFLKPYNNDKPKNTYEPGYWLQCIRDMDEVGVWNTTAPIASLPDDKKTMLWMYTIGNESVGDPSEGNEGWLRFTLCSYLIGQNDWTVLGYEVKNYSTKPLPIIDYSITAKLGVPAGGHVAINNDQYFRCRAYKPTSDFPASVGGVVVVNAYPDKSLQYVIASNATDEDGTPLKKGTSVTIKPHTGRVFFDTAADIVVSLVVPSQTVASGQTLTIQVNYSNSGAQDAKDVTIKAAVPTEMTYVPGSAELLGGSYNATTRIVSWVEPIVKSGANGVKTFGAKVN